MTNKPQRHHTTPCSYLWGFSNNPIGRDSMLWVYDRLVAFFLDINNIRNTKLMYRDTKTPSL